MRSFNFVHRFLAFALAFLGGQYHHDEHGWTSRWHKVVDRAVAVGRMLLPTETYASAKIKFESTLAMWRQIGVGAGSALGGGLMKSSHHFLQIGSQEKPLNQRYACA